MYDQLAASTIHWLFSAQSCRAGSKNRWSERSTCTISRAFSNATDT
jgi:hypothetical protein